MLNHLKQHFSSAKKPIAILLASCVCMSGYFIYTKTNSVSQNADPINSNLYREESVTRGSIIVGLSESGSATMNTSTISYSFETELLERYVKSGQYVEEGDLLFSIDTETLKEEYNELALALEQAQLSLVQAELNAKSKKMEAEVNYQTQSYNGENAQNIYELTILQIETEVSELTDAYYELRAEKEDIQDQLEDGLDNDFNLSSLQEEMEEIQTQLADLNEQKSHAADCNDANCSNNDWIHDTEVLNSQITIAEVSKASLQKDLDKAIESYDTQYEKYEDRLDEIYTQMEKNQATRDQYVSTLELKKLDAQATYDKTVYQYENKDTSYDITLSQIEADTLSAKQKVATLEKQLNDLSEVQIDGEVTAPCSGYIMSIAEMETTQKEGTALVTIADKNSVMIRVSIAQEDIGDISVGMACSALFDAYSEVTLAAVVDSISITPTGGMSSSVNYVVTISCDLQEDMVVYEGMTASITFIQQQKEDVLKISNKCIINEDGKQFVKIKDEQGNVQQIQIETGFSDGFDVEIVSGLEEDDIVILESVVNRNAT